MFRNTCDPVNTTRTLLTQWALEVVNIHTNEARRFRIVEVEVYGPDDPFTHKSPEQLGPDGHWYFHRSGAGALGGFRGGTFKGLDITYGDAGEAGGILIRSLHDLGSHSLAQPQLYEGPCVSVNRILEAVGVSSIAELVERQDFDWNVMNRHGLIRLVPHEYAHNTILTGPRIGLRAEASPEWYSKHLRFVVEHAGVKKQKRSLNTFY